MTQWFKNIWHAQLRRPYNLAKTHDIGNGTGIVLLHGIGSSGHIWDPLIKQLQHQQFSCRVVTYDLLGFGKSPKPTNIDYTVDDQAAAVTAQIKKLRRSKPVVIVGHSMGSLVAVRVAKLRPDLVRHLVLYEMPLYGGLPDKRRYQTRIKLYFNFFDWVTRQQPNFTTARKRFRERIASHVVGSELTAATWQPFIKSLQNTIMQQSAAEDLPQLTMPADIIYGTRDMLVIRGKVHSIFGLDSDLVTMHTIREKHVISTKASKFITERISAALNA